ncbi:unnamed protein product [Parajaminaea phylloscopi]
MSAGGSAYAGSSGGAAGGGGGGGGGGGSSRLGAVPMGGAGPQYARFSSPPISQQQNDQGYDAYSATSPGAGHSFGSAVAGDMSSSYHGSGYGGGQAPMGPNDGFYGSSARNQQHGGPQQPQQQGFGGQFGNFLGNDPNFNMTAQMGMHFGQQMANVGGEYVQKNLGGYLPTMGTLRPLFNVSNSYVLHKLRVILFPWRHRPWSRAHRAPGGGGSAVGGVPPRGSNLGSHASDGAEWAGSADKRPQQLSLEGYAPPREDVNAPDLYVPVMSFVTYVLLIAVSLGLSNRFRPEILGLTSSRALLIVGVELALIRLCTYLFNVQGDHYGILDLLSYSGYKFVPACVTLSVGVLGWGRVAWWSTFFYTHAALAFFLLRSLRHIILPDPASTPHSASAPSVATISQGQRAKRVQLLFIVAVLQFFLGAGLCFRVAG